MNKTPEFMTTFTEKILELKWIHEEENERALWFMTNLNAPFLKLYRNLQIFILENNININQFEELFNELEYDVLYNLCKEKYNMDTNKNVRIYSFQIVGHDIEEFRIVFDMFLDEYKKEKLTKYFICKDCGEIFSLEPKQMEWFKEKNLSLPKRCEGCRAVKKNKVS